MEKKLDDLRQITFRMNVKDRRVIEQLLALIRYSPTTELTADQKAMVDELHTKHSKRIKSFKRNSYVLLPSGEPS